MRICSNDFFVCLCHTLTNFFLVSEFLDSTRSTTSSIFLWTLTLRGKNQFCQCRTMEASVKDIRLQTWPNCGAFNGCLRPTPLTSSMIADSKISYFPNSSPVSSSTIDFASLFLFPSFILSLTSCTCNNLKAEVLLRHFLLHFFLHQHNFITFLLTHMT